MNENRITFCISTNNICLGQSVNGKYRNTIQHIMIYLQSQYYNDLFHNTLYIILDGVVISKVKIK